jgi:two-component system chemotaxis response regulator CheY
MHAAGEPERRVLVVEDEPTIRLILHLALSDAGFQILEAASGHCALQVLDSESVDAVILDPGLPDGLGDAVLQRLDALYEERGSPIWFLLSATDEARLRRRLGSTLWELIPKPFDPIKLADMLMARVESEVEPTSGN